MDEAESKLAKGVEECGRQHRREGGRASKSFMKAWRIRTKHFQDSITHAPSRRIAKYRAWACAKEAGYNLDFGDFRVTRAPEYDDAKYQGEWLSFCIGEEYLPEADN